jgi:hypothetical protein
VTKPRPKTGEARKTRQPLKIDRLPATMQKRICSERSAWKSWEQIEAESAAWTEWNDVPEDVQKLFPDRRLPHSNLQRWYDLRVEQRLKEQRAEAERARSMADAFTKNGFADLTESVRNALGERVFMLMRAGNDEEFQEALLDLGHLLAKLDKNRIAKLHVDTESRRVKLLEEEAERKRKVFDKQTNDAAKKLGKGESLTVADINRIRERTFGLPPVQPGAAASHPA